MNLGTVEAIAKAVLYEGYMLYPYRPSSVKNRQRWNFGVLYPRSYSEAQRGTDAWRTRTECLVQGGSQTTIEIRGRFLHLVTRSERVPAPLATAVPPLGEAQVRTWQEAVERDVIMLPFQLGSFGSGPLLHEFTFPAESIATRENETVTGTIRVDLQPVGEAIFKLAVEISNNTWFEIGPDKTRDGALMCALASAHTILGVENGKFVSLLDPPESMKDLAASCTNIGTWPVLVGEAGQTDTLLSSPIILYDYPQIAPESPGDLFDGTEIDEILSLRIMTLTDDEKQEMRQSDDRARQILERTETLPAEQFMKLHGVLRSLHSLKENSQ